MEKLQEAIEVLEDAISAMKAKAMAEYDRTNNRDGNMYYDSANRLRGVLESLRIEYHILVANTKRRAE